MYLLTGFVLWLLCLILVYLVPKFFVVDELVRDLYKEFEQNTFSAFMTAGVISIVIIIGWPLIIFLLGLIIAVGLFGGVPYLLIRKMKSSIKESKTTRGR